MGVDRRGAGTAYVADDTTTLVATGLLCMHARHYTSELGRFLTPDPAVLETSLYPYAENSPVTKVDPGCDGHLRPSAPTPARPRSSGAASFPQRDRVPAGLV